MKKYSMSLFFFASVGVAVACTALAALTINVGQVSNNPVTAQGQIGDRLQAAFGSVATPAHDVEVRVQYQVSFMGFTSSHSLPFSKPCGKTFSQVGQENQERLQQGQQTGAGGGYDGTLWDLFPGWSGCIYGCGIVDVGEVDPV
jgi:hypothetical protein